MFTYNSKLLINHVCNKKHDFSSKKEYRELYKFFNTKYNSIKNKKELLENKNKLSDITSPFLSSDIQEKN